MFMTHPTKAIYKLILSDFVKVSDVSPDDTLFTEQDLAYSLTKIELIDYHQEKEHNGIRFWCYNAGHVLGAAMFMIDIAGVKVLYTGDFSRQSDRHLLGAETPTLSPDVLIVEATYGIQVHEPRREREMRFTSMVHNVVKQGGRCLIPVFALGRAQELLLILDEFWESHPELQKIPIYYASSLAKKSMAVFQTYINMMNDKIRKQFDISNPFIFKHISNLKSIDHFEDKGPCVIMAAPGMLQSGLSKQLFEMWCSDPRNGVVLPGYCVEGTLAKRIMAEPSEIALSTGAIVPLRMTIQTISFSAHSDCAQTKEFIEAINPPHVILVHGDVNNCNRLKQELQKKFEERIKVYTPKNCETIEIMFRSDKVAKVLGDLAKRPAERDSSVSGILVQKNFQHHIVAPQDLKTYTDISCAGVRQRLMVPLPLPKLDTDDKQKLKTYTQEFWTHVLQRRFQHVVPIHDPNAPEHLVTLCISGAILMKIDMNRLNEAAIEWESNAASDIVVDGICNSILDDDGAMSDEEEVDPKSEMQILYCIQQMLSEQYSTVSVDLQKQHIHLNIDGYPVVVNSSGHVKCENPKIASLLEITMRRIFLALFPIPSMMGCLDETDPAPCCQ